jgi:periplasmic divalent cation tolerance protein
MLRVVLCNCSPDESEDLARALVSEKYAACVNILTGVKSFYEWDGELCEDVEHTLLIKTTDARVGELKARLESLHSYDVPEIIALESTDVLESYAEWVRDQTS